jgi:hypothetical protein
MSVKDIDPYTWFGERELNYVPKHFVVSPTPLTLESKIWVLENLRSRFSIIPKYSFLQVEGELGKIAFEDPEEATFYELKWS